VIVQDVRGRLGTPEVLGLMRIKNESQSIRESIESQLPICDRVLVLDDHSTDGTQDIVRSFGDRCVLVDSQFDGVSEGRDKRFLLAYAIAVNPAWVLWIDGDEVLEDNAKRLFEEEFARPEACAYVLRMLYFWDSLTQIRMDGVYGYIAKPSLFRVRGQDTSKLFIPAGTGSADLHNNGNCPVGLVGHAYASAARIKHYGYVHKEERHRKYEFYNRLDPNNESEDGYRHIIETPGARHAPGPTLLVPYEKPT